MATVTTPSSFDFKSEESNSNLVVALRIRPMMDDEIHNGATPIAHRIDENMVVIMDPADDLDDILRQNRSREKQYIFDMVLDAKSTQQDTYNKTCKFLIPGIINGYNATVFAYGATGAGKTHTMLGRDDHIGIMAQALTDLFEKMKQSEDMLTFKVTMSYLEIYNEMIRDLLNPNNGYLDLREDQSNGLQVAGLSDHEVTNTLEVMDILNEGNKQRTQEPTAANKTSSRSHAVLIVQVRQKNRLAAGMRQQYRMGKLFLIDLAGSERAANTQNRGKRMVEGAHINRSLLALGNCINALSDKSGSKYVNYRDSKLTRLLKDALGGNCKTVMVAHISPASFHFEESRNTLSYADRAKNLKTKVRQNVYDMTLHISQYSNVITDLKEEVRRLKQRLEERNFNANRNLITMQAIQSEVFSQKDEQELARLKKELNEAHKNLMDLRQNLSELKNNQTEINLELMRQQMLLTSYRRMNDLDLDGKERLRDLSSKNIEEIAKDLAALEAERSKVEIVKKGVEHQLKVAVDRTTKIEEELFQIPTSSNGGRSQREAVNLLAKVHRLELENLQLYEELTNHVEDSRRRSVLVERRMRQCNLAEEIINRQKDIIIAENVLYPAELQNLYLFYKQEVEELNQHQQMFRVHEAPSSLMLQTENIVKPLHARSSDDIISLMAPSTADNSQYKMNNHESTFVINNYRQSHDQRVNPTRAMFENVTKSDDVLTEVDDDISLFVADMTQKKLRDDKMLSRKKILRKEGFNHRTYLSGPLTQSRLAEHNQFINRTSSPGSIKMWSSVPAVGSERSKFVTKKKQNPLKRREEIKVNNRMNPTRFKKANALPSPDMSVEGTSFRKRL